MTHIVTFIAPVPTDQKDKYLEVSTKMSAFFKAQGALRYVETWGTDVPPGDLTSFPLAVKLEEGETIALAWIEWPSKDHADKAWEAMQQDPAMGELMMEAPLDGKRMIYGGFDLLLDVRAD